MGFSKNTSCTKDTEAKLASNGTIATEVEDRKEVGQCCQKCKTHKLLIVLQGLLILLLLVLIIILFVMVFNIKVKLDERLPPLSKRTIDLREGPSHGYSKSMKNSNHDETTESPKQNKSKVLTTAKVTDTVATLKPFLKEVEVLTGFFVPTELPKHQYRREPETSQVSLDAVTLANGTNCTCIGQRGPMGPPGYRGRRGRRGKKAQRGEPGARGERGIRGLPGKAGPPGDVGSIGLPGPPGLKGDKGDNGRRPINKLPVCHATGYQVLSLLHEMPKGILKDWEIDDGWSTLTGGFKFSKGIMTIPEYGFYNVYSQVFFQADTPGLDVHLVHYVYLFRKMGKKKNYKYIILRGFATKSVHTQGDQSFFTTHASGVFRLYEGDRLAVGVDPTHLPLISYAESATYFGAYMI